MITPRGPHVAALTIYPLKSAAGCAVETLYLDARGAMGDRRWLLVDPHGEQITARDTPALVRIVPGLPDGPGGASLTLCVPGQPGLAVRSDVVDAPARMVRVWDDEVLARDMGESAAAWCSQAIGRPCRLVHLDDASTRPLRERFAGGMSTTDRTVAFTDGAPLLVLGLASIDALNHRLVAKGETQLMDRRRFRANVWLAGLTPHEEDTWRRVQIGERTLGVGSWCARCVLTTVDPDTAEKGHEPLRTFATYRRHDGGVVFGVNCTHDAPGELRVGMPVQVIALR
jgi:uncharacterized protein YcbX